MLRAKNKEHGLHGFRWMFTDFFNDIKQKQKAKNKEIPKRHSGRVEETVGGDPRLKHSGMTVQKQKTKENKKQQKT